jgi:hypothetical protein
MVIDPTGVNRSGHPHRGQKHGRCPLNGSEGLAAEIAGPDGRIEGDPGPQPKNILGRLGESTIKKFFFLGGNDFSPAGDQINPNYA